MMLILMDMDSTVIKLETMDEMARLLGKGDEVAKITDLAMQGGLDFQTSFEKRIAILKDIEAAPLINKTINLLKEGITDGAYDLLNYLKSQNIHTVLISGGFDFAAKTIAKELGFDEYYANHLIIDEKGYFTGGYRPPLIDRQFKGDRLETLCHQHGLDKAQTIAIGDGANDLDMLSKAGLGIAFCAKDIVKQQISHHINEHSLTPAIAMINDYKRGLK